MAEAGVGRGRGRLRRHPPRGPGAREFLALPRRRHPLRLAASQRLPGPVTGPRGGSRSRRLEQHLRHERDRAVAGATAALVAGGKGAVDILVRRGARSQRPRVARTHRLW